MRLLDYMHPTRPVVFLFFFDRITFPFPLGQSRKQFMSMVNQGEKVIIERPLFPPPIKLKTAILISTVEN